MKTFTLLALVGLSIASTATALICPPADLLAPCICHESNSTINCLAIRGRFNLKQILDRAAPHVGPDVIFDLLRVQDTPIAEIDDDTFSTWKFRNITFYFNQNLVYISPQAFGATRQVTQSFRLYANYKPQETDVFEVARQFPNLVVFESGSNELATVPDNAFENLHSLEEIDLGYNGIQEIGSRSFSQLPNLRRVDLRNSAFTLIPAGAFENLTKLEELNLRNSEVANIGSRAFFGTDSLRVIDMYSNDILPEGHPADAFEGIGTNVAIDWTYTSNLLYMEETSFKPLLERARRISVGGQSCSRNGCMTRTLYCDERADWICDGLERYEEKLGGFRCRESGIENIAAYCRGGKRIH